MGTPYVGQIICVGFNFPPVGWAICDGSLLPISENETLFSLIGTTYGGDGQNTFALPDLRGRTPIGAGQGNYNVLGQQGGTENVTLTLNQLPMHSHQLSGSSSNGSANAPGGATFGANQSVYAPGAPGAAMNPAAIKSAPGGSQPHNNLQPYTVCNWIISLYGVYPPQN